MQLLQGLHRLDVVELMPHLQEVVEQLLALRTDSAGFSDEICDFDSGFV